MLSTRPKLRLAVIFLGFLVILSLSLLVLHQAVFPILAWFIPALEVPFFDLAVYGAYPEQDYVSFELPSAQTNIVQWDEEKCDNGLILAALNGASVSHPGPFVYDSRGNLVWTTTEYGVAMNLRLQQYKGQDVLTFWAGKKAATSGKGNYFMLDNSYKLVKKVQAVGEGLFGDLHEFKITENNTALITVYNTTQADLSKMGWFRSEYGWITDSIFQEIDLETDKLLFEWRASEHFAPAESYMTQPFSGYRESAPFDSFHINSVDKDPETGNYLVSSRHTHTISLVDGKSGEVLWILGGGINNQFEDLSGGEATSFKWQHDARWTATPADTGKEGVYEVSFFDNGMAGILHADADHSKATIVRLDTVKMTAELVRVYASLGHTLAGSQGSVEILPESGNVFVGWGASAAWTEFSADGQILCEAHLAAASSFAWERVKSYRIMKIASWIGKPTTSPSAKVSGGKVYVSWNGATEVRAWELQAQKERSTDWEAVDVLEKTGFEDAIALPPKSDDYVRFRASALDDEKNSLGTSNEVERISNSWSWFAFLVALAASATGVALWAVRVLLRKRRGWNAGLFAGDWDLLKGGSKVRYRPL